MQDKERPPLITVLCIFLVIQLVYMGIDLFQELTSHASGALNKKGELIPRINMPLHIAFMIALGIGAKGVWDMMRWGAYTLSGYFLVKVIYEFTKYNPNMGTIALSLVCMAAPWIYITQMEE